MTKRKAIALRARTAAGCALACLALPTLGSGCGGPSGAFVQQQAEPIVERRPAADYDQLFPYYAEICAVSQFRSKDKGFGGAPGHAVMYVKGACSDESSAYPRLRRCRRVATDPDDPEHGAGISVNRWFRNANWVATPGQELFYAGNLAPDERLTQEHLEATVRDAIALGVFRGVELHEYPTPAPERSLEDFVLRQSVATDFALQYARSVFCARLPVTSDMLDEIMAFLNDKNREYFTGEADYEWSGLADNCVHTLRNALAAAGVWEPVSVRAVKLRRIFNLAIPANEFVNLARLGAEGSLDFESVRRDRVQREALLEFDWLPTRHGALVKTMPVHAKNEVFDTTFRIFVLQSPLRRGQSRHARRMLADARYHDLGANLRHFAERYDRILARDAGGGLADVRGDPERRLRRRYRSYMEAQRDEVREMLSRQPASGGAGS